MNDLPAIVRIVRERSDAIVFVDAVRSVPHVPFDVAATGCDLLAFSPCKMFGLRQGVLWGRADLLDRMVAYKVRPAAVTPTAIKFETGTQSLEAQAGVAGVIAYLEWLGREFDPAADGRRRRLPAAMEGCAAYEREIGERLLAGLAALPAVRLYGRTGMDGRVPTFGFTVARYAPRNVARRLADRGLFVWSGHFYAVGTIDALGLTDQGGPVRVGLCQYDTSAEVDALLAALADLRAETASPMARGRFPR